MAPNLLFGTGWVPDQPDHRDRTPDHHLIAPMLARTHLTQHLRSRRRLPPTVDLRAFCPPVRFQGGFNTCSAHVVSGLVDYFQRRAHGRPFDASRLFLHKVAKNFLQEDGNVGVHIRQTMGALRLLGVPPEKYWPYVDAGSYKKPNAQDGRLDAEPSPFVYALANEHRAVSYYRLDDPTGKLDPRPLLRLIKLHLAAQIPLAFGFNLYLSALETAKKGGLLSTPGPGEAIATTHAVVGVGFDDTIEIPAGAKGGEATRGALLIQNSWSENWGEKGFGWLPYEYVLDRHARDFWTLLKTEWIDTGEFDLNL